MAGDIVPIELGLTDGDLVTLWAPKWREGDDEWEAFLGHGDDLYGFPSVAHLVAFVRANNDNDLVEHPAWPVVSKLAAIEFEPDEAHAFDLIGVPELVAGDLDPVFVSELQDTFDIVSILGDVCELDVVTKFFERPEVDTVLRYGVAAFDDRTGADLWNKLGAAVVEDWDAVIDALDAVVTTPDTDEAALSEIESELVAVDENDVEADDAVDDAEDDEYEYVDDEAGDDFWASVGIDPIKIITTEARGSRCVATSTTTPCSSDPRARSSCSGPNARSAGTSPTITTTIWHRWRRTRPSATPPRTARSRSRSPRTTSTYSPASRRHRRGRHRGRSRADGTRRRAVHRCRELRRRGRDRRGTRRLDRAGWFVNYVIEPDSSRLAPSAPFDAEAVAWRDLEREFEAHLRKL